MDGKKEPTQKEQEQKLSNKRWEVCKEKDFVKLLVSVLGDIKLVGVVWGAGLPQQRSGWAGGLLSGGEGGTWGCQAAWQVETQRPVTGGEHGSVREDRSEGMEAAEG